MRTVVPMLLPALLLLLGTSPASAHIIGARLGDFYGGAFHPLTTLPDLVLWLALGLLAAMQETRWARFLVVVFPAGLLAGFAAGRAWGWASDPMPVDAALMIGLGGLTAASVRLPGKLLLLLAFAIAVFRGAANASGVDATTDITLFACGLAACGYAVITLVVALVETFRRSGGWQPIAVRAGGSWIAAIGVMAGGYALSAS